jgi:hypothetical protein
MEANGTARTGAETGRGWKVNKIGNETEETNHENYQSEA